MEIVFSGSGISETHKTTGLTRAEYRKLFTISEQILNDKARAKIDGSLGWMTGTVGPDDDAADVGFPGATYRDLLRTVYKSFEDADTINCDDPFVIMAISVQEKLGLISSSNRKDEIRKGKKL